jgi:hypothetical protein
MKCTYLWTGLALGAWAVFGPADLSHAQSTSIGSSNNAQGSAGTGASGGPGPTTGVGGGVGGNYGGVSGGGVGGRYGGASGGGVGGQYSGGTTRPSSNMNNAGAQDRYRGQGIDFSRNETGGGVGTGNGNQFDRYNGGANSNTATARDRYRSQQEQLNDTDDFQSDPNQSRRSSTQGRNYDRRRDAIERRRYQEDRLLDHADGDIRDRYNDRFNSRYNDRNRSRDRNDDGYYGGTTNVFIDGDDGYGYVDGAYVDDNGNYIGRGVASQYAPQRTTRDVGRGYTNRTSTTSRDPATNRMNTGRNPLPRTAAEKESMDRAANYVDANRGRQADDQLNEELPNETGTAAGRRVDARLDPRAR